MDDAPQVTRSRKPLMDFLHSEHLLVVVKATENGIDVALGEGAFLNPQKIAQEIFAIVQPAFQERFDAWQKEQEAKH